MDDLSMCSRSEFVSLHINFHTYRKEKSQGRGLSGEGEGFPELGIY